MESRDPVKRWILRHEILTVVLGNAGLIMVGAAFGNSEDSCTLSGPSQASTKSTSSSRCEPMPSVAADFFESACSASNWWARSSFHVTTSSTSTSWQVASTESLHCGR